MVRAIPWPCSASWLTRRDRDHVLTTIWTPTSRLIKYLREEFQTRPYGYLDGDLDFKIIPGFFSWIARETYVDAVIIPTQPVTPDNLEGINFATTGPRFTLRPTLRTTITINGTYSYIDSNSQSPLYVNVNNRRYAGDATIDQALSNTTSVYLGGSWQKVNFVDTTINTNFTEDQGNSATGTRMRAPCSTYRVDTRSCASARRLQRLRLSGDKPDR